MTEKIRILHVIDSFNIGGTEKQCVEIAKNINKEKYHTEVATFNEKGLLAEELASEGILFTEFKIARGFYSPRSLFSILRLGFFIKRKKFHIVQTYGFFSTVPGVIAAKIARIPIVICGKRNMNLLLPRFKLSFEKLLWRFCNIIVANSKAVKKHLVDSENISENKITVIHNGIDIARMSMTCKDEVDPRGDTIGMLANLRDEKDHKTFLEAAAKVLREIPATKFLLIGNGPLEKELKAYAHRLGVGGNVVFCGQKTGSELYNTICKLSISVLSSVTESMPNALLESMACGIPVIGTAAGGIPEVIEDGINGCIFPPKRPDMLAEKIIYLLRNKTIAMDMGKRGMQKVEKEFSAKLMCDNFEKLYDSLLGRDKS